MSHVDTLRKLEDARCRADLEIIVTFAQSLKNVPGVTPEIWKAIEQHTELWTDDLLNKLTPTTRSGLWAV